VIAAAVGIWGAPPVVMGVSTQGIIMIHVPHPAVLSGFGAAENNLHAPNENMPVSRYLQGIEFAGERLHLAFDVGELGRGGLVEFGGVHQILADLRGAGGEVFGNRRAQELVQQHDEHDEVGDRPQQARETAVFAAVLGIGAGVFGGCAVITGGLVVARGSGLVLPGRGRLRVGLGRLGGESAREEQRRERDGDEQPRRELAP